MAVNTLGKIFTVTSFGESHGAYVGCVIDGVPSNIKIDIKKIQQQVSRRKPKNTFDTKRIEDDMVEIISGLFNNKTTGAPICILIKNNNTISADYKSLENIYRPNHADFTYAKKYENRDFNGGGRSSIRITAPMVAAGALAEQIINSIHKQTVITAFVKSVGSEILKVPSHTISRTLVDKFETRIPNAEVNKNALKCIDVCKKNGDTLGGVISCQIQNMPIGIGEPIFNKLQAQLAHAMLSINTVKGFEYGTGFESAIQKGSTHNDNFIFEKNKVKTKSNNSGGIQGGISNGMPIIFNVAFKPISSIAQPQKTINNKNKAVTLVIKGRHDVCAVPRAVPIVEAYTAIVLLDLILQNKIYNA